MRLPRVFAPNTERYAATRGSLRSTSGTTANAKRCIFAAASCSNFSPAIKLQAAIIPPPAVVTLLRYANVPANLDNRPTLSQKNIRLMHVINDLLD